MRAEINFRHTTKAAFAFAFTTATYLLARTTGFLPSWFSEETSVEEGALGVTVIPRDDGFGIAGQRRLLQTGGVTVANPVPDQVVQVDQQYTYPLDNVFSGNYSLLGAVETSKNSLPSWLNLEPKLLSTFSAGTTVRATAISGSIAFVAASTAGLKILDVSNANNPRLLSSVSSGGGSAMRVLINGSTVFVANGAAGLQIVNITNINSPKLISTFPSQNGTAYDVAISGSTVFVADDNIGLQIIDVSNISNPRLLIVFPAGTGSAKGVAISGNIAFVADDTAGLKIIDVSNTTNPRLISTFASAAAWSVATSGNTVYVANIINLQILDVSNISNPRLIFSYPAGLTWTVQGVAIVGNTLFVANGGLQVFDVTNTSNPRLLSNLPSGANAAFEITVNENMAFLAVGNAGLQIFNLSQGIFTGVPPISEVGKQISITASVWNMDIELISNRFTLTLDQLPRVVTSTVADQSVYPGQSIGLSLSSTLLFTNPGNSFLKLTIKSNKGTLALKWLNLNLQPTLVSTMFQGVGPQVHDVAINGTIAFVTNNNLKILDVIQPNNPRLLSTVPSGGSGVAWQTVIEGSTAFVAWTSVGLKIIDVSNASNPRLLSTYPFGSAYGIALSPGTAFVADRYIGLQIIDVSNMSNPRLITTYPFGGSGYTNAVAISGSTAFVSVLNVGLKILDVSNTSNPRLLSSCPSGAESTAISGNTAFVAYGLGGLKIFDVTNTSNPRLLSVYSAQGAYATHVKIVGSTAFVAASSSGLQIFDVSNTSDPHLLGSHPGVSGGQAYSTAVTGNMAFLADYNAGLLILDISQWILSAVPNATDVGNYELQLVATDELGGTASTQPFTIRVEGPPQITGNISTQYARVGQFFNYFTPQGLFVDPNFDPISFTATLVDGSMLPNWLAFNGISAAFAGTPTAADNITILLHATDNIAGSVNTTFNLITSYLPVVDLPIAEQVARVSQPYAFTVPSTAFFDQDGDISNYTALRANGQALPSWLRFNATVPRFSGYPNQTEVGQYDLQMIATDRYNGQASTLFTLWVEYFPVVNQTLTDQLIGAGDLFNFALPPLAFTDADSSQLNYRARRPDGSSLPNWLAFNPQTLVFSGQPLQSDIGVLTVQVVASDPLGASATQNFNLTIVAVPTLGTIIPRQLLNVGRPYQFPVPASAFNYAGSDALHYFAYQQFNQSLPSWLQFNNATLIFSGTPQNNHIGDYALSVVACDNYAHTVTNPFDLIVERFPVVNQSIPSLSASVGNPMIFTIASDAFADPDGDPLTYSARRADSSALPNWLTFDGSRREFSGIPVITDVGTMSLQVTATDLPGGSVQQNFTLTILYAPVVNTPPPAIQPLREDRAFNLSLSAQTFSDPGGALLNYSATQLDGSPLPAWLSFFPQNLSFSGMPGITDVGTLALQVTATNPQGAYVNLPLSFVIWSNYPPQVMQTISNQIATVLSGFQFFAPTDTFTDVNEDALHYTATQVNGQPLPGWLHFDAQRLGFFGTPSRRDTGDFSARVIPIALTAHDDKSSTSTQFNISVEGTSNVALFLKVIIPLLSILTTGYTVYKKRAFLLNRYKPQRYQRLAEEKLTVGDGYERQLATPAEQVKKVQVMLPHPRKDYLRLFMLPYEPLPGNVDLPIWLEYDTNTNTLRSTGPIPPTASPHLIVQVRGKDNVVLEQFPLHINRDLAEAKGLGEAPTEASTQSVTPALPTIDEEDAIEMQPVSSNMGMNM